MSVRQSNVGYVAGDGLKHECCSNYTVAIYMESTSTAGTLDHELPNAESCMCRSLLHCSGLDER